MFKLKRILAVIPARGGSKRIPRKNLQLFRNRPLIDWSIAAARASRFIDMLVGSSEDDEILAHFITKGVHVVNRPAGLATDQAMNEDVLRHVLEKYPDYDFVVLLQPTSPLRTHDDIDECIRKAVNNTYGCISFNEEGAKNGAIYIATTEMMKAGFSFSQPGHMLAPYFMPNRKSLDIDYPEQLKDDQYQALADHHEKLLDEHNKKYPNPEALDQLEASLWMPWLRHG